MTVHGVSVVMSVCNGAQRLRASVESVLAQQGVDLELVVVDDGSTDGSAAAIDAIAAADSRVRVIRQPNAGLTRALVRGCAAARHALVARQDVGDLFLPGKLALQAGCLAAHPDAAMVSCGTRFVGPDGEILDEARDEAIDDAFDATPRLAALDAVKLRGPYGHGSVVFRRDLYESVGGYRPEFRVGQDLDLWVRLAERGRHLVLPQVLFQALFTADSISGRRRALQLETARIVVECARLRRAGMSEAPALARAAALGADGAPARARDVAGAHYFVGACLRRRGDPRADRYFRMALRAYPLHVRSALRVLLG